MVNTHATTIHTTPEGRTQIVYHRTVVVDFGPKRDGPPDGRTVRRTVRLDSGGWRTSTTKRRMNQAARQYGLGFTVFQREFRWYVRLDGVDGVVLDFEDGMEFTA